MPEPEIDWKDLCFRILEAVSYSEGEWFENDWKKSDEELESVRAAYHDWYKNVRPPDPPDQPAKGMEFTPEARQAIAKFVLGS